jgi:hypothetical protein
VTNVNENFLFIERNRKLSLSLSVVTVFLQFPEAGRGSVGVAPSAVCNQAWLDRPGSYKLLAEAQACNQIAEAKKFLARGFQGRGFWGEAQQVQEKRI